MIRLEEYGPGLVQQGFTTIQDICTVSIEDLEDIGVYKLGHQKRLLLAIKKIKEIIQGSKRISEKESPCVYKTQEIPVQPSLQSGSIRHDKFSSFHQPLPTHVKPNKASLNLNSSPYTTYGLQDDLPPPFSHELPPPSPHDLPSPIAHDLPEPMEPLHYPVYRPGPGMTRSHDPHLIKTSLSGGGIFPPQSSFKTKPIAMVAASARITEDSCHPGTDHHKQQHEECPDIPPLRHSHNHLILRRNSVNNFPVKSSMEVVDDNVVNTDTTCHEDTNLLMSKSGPCSPSLTLPRRNRSIPDRDKNSSFIKHSSAVHSRSGTPERSRSR